MTKPSPNAALTGLPDAYAQLATPCLVLDLPALNHNIAKAASFCHANKIALRPHAKSHKSASIGALQMKAGAVGLCVATIGEAEAMAARGLRDLLITSAFTQDNKIARAVRLAAGGCTLQIVADDPGMVDQFGAAAQQANAIVTTLVDVDLGKHRNGVVTAEQAVAVVNRIKASPSLRFGGMQAYASHISHLTTYAERLRASEECKAIIIDICAALAKAGHAVERITGGSTGTLFMDPGLHCYTELQCGSYVFNDVEYAGIELDGGSETPFVPSLFVRVTVIGRNNAGRVTCDGGNKHFSAKGTLPAFRQTPAPGAVYRPDSDEHGIIELPDGAEQPALGTSFDLIVPHCDPTVNLYDHFHVVEGNKLTGIWPIEARGAF
jgi:D-serine deaminase-like pyridoxal phosphate-dependent protein